MIIPGGIKEMRIRSRLERIKRELEKADALMGKLVLSAHPDAPALLAEHLPEARELREKIRTLLSEAEEALKNQP